MPFDYEHEYNQLQSATEEFLVMVEDFLAGLGGTGYAPEARRELALEANRLYRNHISQGKRDLPIAQLAAMFPTPEEVTAQQEVAAVRSV